MPLPEQREVAEKLADNLWERENGTISEDEIERREREFEQKMYVKGFFANIATRNETDEEFDSFELLEIEGEPLSEQIIRERRWTLPTFSTAVL